MDVDEALRVEEVAENSRMNQCLHILFVRFSRQEPGRVGEERTAVG